MWTFYVLLRKRHLLIPLLLKGIYFMCQDYSSDKNIQGNKQSQTGLALPSPAPPPPRRQSSACLQSFSF